jgi:hypothetical protein
MKVESKEEAKELSAKYGEIMSINWRKKLQSYIVGHLSSLDIPDDKIDNWDSQLNPVTKTKTTRNSEMKVFPDSPIGIKPRDLLIACVVVMAAFGGLWLKINSARSPLDTLIPKVENIETRLNHDIEVRKRLFELKYDDNLPDSLIDFNSTLDQVSRKNN